MKIAVIGAGLPGLVMAFHLAAQGVAVEVLEALGAPGQGASACAVGALNPLRPREVHTLSEAQLQSFALLPGLMQQASEVSGLPHGHATNGRLQLAHMQALPFAIGPFLNAANRRWAELVADGPAAELLNRAEVIRRWGPVFRNVDYFIYDRVAQQVHVPTATACLLKALRRLNVTVQTGAQVVALMDNGQSVAVTLAHETRSYDKVIACAGMGMAEITQNEKPVLPVRANYGEAFSIRGFLPPNAPGIFAHNRYIQHWADGTGFVGSTSHDAFIDPPPLVASQHSMAQRLGHYLINPAALQPLRIWSGIRPVGLDETPFIGAISPTIMAAGGFHKIGLSLMGYAAMQAERFVLGQTLGPPLATNRRMAA